MPSYIVQFQSTFEADSEAQAMLIADRMVEMGGADLEEDDTFDITQVVENKPLAKLTPQEVTLRLTLARNDLIRTGFRDCWNVARELDKIIHSLSRLIEPGDNLPDYDYGHFTDVAHEILNLNRSPIDGAER